MHAYKQWNVTRMQHQALIAEGIHPKRAGKQFCANIEGDSHCQFTFSIQSNHQKNNISKSYSLHKKKR